MTSSEPWRDKPTPPTPAICCCHAHHDIFELRRPLHDCLGHRLISFALPLSWLGLSLYLSLRSQDGGSLSLRVLSRPQLFVKGNHKSEAERGPHSRWVLGLCESIDLGGSLLRFLVDCKAQSLRPRGGRCKWRLLLLSWFCSMRLFYPINPAN